MIRKDVNELQEKISNLVCKIPIGLTIEEVANELKINRITASKYLALLEAHREIVVRKMGRAKLHYPKTKRSQVDIVKLYNQDVDNTLLRKL